MEELLGKETSWGFSHQATDEQLQSPPPAHPGVPWGGAGEELRRTGTLLGNRQKL